MPLVFSTFLSGEIGRALPQDAHSLFFELIILSTSD